MNHPEPSQIRNFSIIAHVNHGKSTLADRLLEMTHAVDHREMRSQFLDSLALERERGITIKLKAVRLRYRFADVSYQLNLIDTPGHVDFGYEVSRSLAACEGAILVVDAASGVQAQTLANVQKALEQNLKIVTFVNKIDLSQSRPAAVIEEIKRTFDFLPEDIVSGSAKTGEGVEELLELVITKIPSPKFLESEAPLKALVFDSLYDDHQGVLAFIRIFEGSVHRGDRLRLIRSDLTMNCLELGFYGPARQPVATLLTGEVGYLATGIKDLRKLKVGDTVTSDLPNGALDLASMRLPGYPEPRPLVYLSFFPASGEEFPLFRTALEKIFLTDSSITFEPESSPALGRGFRCGFLGLLHAEVLRQRLERDYQIRLITSRPSVRYRVGLTSGEEILVDSASAFPDPSQVEWVKEPVMLVSLFSPSRYLGPVMILCRESRGVLTSSQYLGDSVRLTYELPLSEILFDFHDKLKSLTAGFASHDYEFLTDRATEVVKLDILVAGKLVEPLSQLVVKTKSYKIGKELVVKLGDLLPRQQFAVSLQAAIGGRVVAREDIPPLRKNVLAKMSGGHRERKDKLLERQRRGKEKLRRFGKVDIPLEVFTNLLKLN